LRDERIGERMNRRQNQKNSAEISFVSTTLNILPALRLRAERIGGKDDREEKPVKHSINVFSQH